MTNNSNDIIDMDVCAIQSTAINAVYADVRKLLEQDEKTASLMRHVLIKHAFATKEMMVVFITRKNDAAKLKKIGEQLIRLHPNIKSVIMNINERKDNVILGDQETVLCGKEYITDQMDTFSFHISSRSFYQVNPVQTKVLYETALKACQLHGDETVLDLYCGVGTISMFLARHAKKVIGIEIVGPAIVNAKENARRNNITNVEFICSDAADYAKKVVDNKIKLDVVCVDPPRKGCAASVLENIVQMSPKRIVYVSCDAATLARDLHILEGLGYKTQMVQPVDMFPQTYSVETVVLLGREKSTDDIVYGYVDYEPKNEDYIQDMKGNATYSEIKDWIKEKYGFSVSSLYVAQIKEKYGFEKRPNYNIGDKKSRVPVCPVEKEKAIVDAFKHFRMI